eukprot:COSAG05_NODE_4375_length_1545_cov_1.423928_1_plen_37_part_10
MSNVAADSSPRYDLDIFCKVDEETIKAVQDVLAMKSH